MISPRKPTSIEKKSSPIPKDLTSLISESFQESFEKELRNREVLVTGKIYSEEIVVRVGLHEPGHIRQMNFEASIDFQHGRTDSVGQIHACVDAISTMLAEYLTSIEEIVFPLTWAPYKFENQEIFLMTSTENFDLEAQADALLAQTEPAQKEADDHELHAIKHAYGLEDIAEQDEEEDIATQLRKKIRH